MYDFETYLITTIYEYFENEQDKIDEFPYANDKKLLKTFWDFSDAYEYNKALKNAKNSTDLYEIINEYFVNLHHDWYICRDNKFVKATNHNIEFGDKLYIKDGGGEYCLIKILDYVYRT